MKFKHVHSYFRLNEGDAEGQRAKVEGVRLRMKNIGKLLFASLAFTLFFSNLPISFAPEYTQATDTVVMTRDGQALGTGLSPQYEGVKGTVSFYLNGTVAVTGNHSRVKPMVLNPIPTFLTRVLTHTLWLSSNGTVVKQQYLNTQYNVNLTITYNFQYANGQKGEKIYMFKASYAIAAPYISDYNVNLTTKTVRNWARGIATEGVVYDFSDAISAGRTLSFNSSGLTLRVTSGSMVFDPVLWLEITGISNNVGLYSGGSVRSGQRLNTGNFTNGTIEVVQVSYRLQKTGSPTGNAVSRIRAVSDDSIISNSTTTLDVSTLTSDGSYPWVAFTHTQVTVNVNARFAVEYGGGNADNRVQAAFTTAQDGSGVRTEYVTSWTDYGSDHNIRIYTPNTAPNAPGEFTTSVSWRPNSASNLVWRARDADGQGDLSTCRITGTVNSGGAFDFTYTFSTDGIAWTTQPTGLTAGTASKTSVNSSAYAVTVPLTFSGAYGQVGTVTITTTNTRCTDADSATTALGSNTNVGTMYGRITWTINDNSGAALTPSGTVYLRWNNGTARQNSGNSVAVTGQTDTSVQYSVQWQNSTASNAYVFGETTLTVNEAWENVTVTTLVYPSLTYAFRRADASTSITPTNIVITVPNNSTAKTLTSFSSLLLPNGTITVTSISYLGGNVRLNASDSHSFTAASQTRTFNTRVYHGGSIAFRRNDNSTAITPTNMTVTAYNSTALTLTSFTSLIFGNGTNTVTRIYWGNANVRGNTSDTFSMTANSQSRTYNLRIYSILPSFNRNGGSSLNTAVTSWTITSANGTVSSAFTSAALTTNGSATIGTVLWRAIGVTPSSASFTPSTSNPSFNVNVYADSSNNMQSAVDTGTLSSVAFSSNTLTFTVSSVSGSRQVITEILAADYRVAPLTVKVAGSTVTNHTYTSPNLVSYTGAVSGLAMSEEWPAPGTGAGGETPPPSPLPPATPSGGGGGSPHLTTTVTTAAAPIEAIKARTEELRKQVQQKTALESEKTAGTLILVSLAAAFGIFTYSWYYKRSLLKSPSRDDLQGAYAKLKKAGRFDSQRAYAKLKKVRRR